MDARIVWVYDLELLVRELKHLNGYIAVRLSSKIFVISAPYTHIRKISKNAATFIPPVDLMTKIEIRKFAVANSNITEKRKKLEFAKEEISS